MDYVRSMECGMWAGLTDVTDAGVFPSAGSLYYLQVNQLPTNSPNMFVSWIPYFGHVASNLSLRSALNNPQ